MTYKISKRHTFEVWRYLWWSHCMLVHIWMCCTYVVSWKRKKFLNPLSRLSLCNGETVALSLRLHFEVQFGPVVQSLKGDNWSNWWLPKQIFEIFNSTSLTAAKLIDSMHRRFVFISLRFHSRGKFKKEKVGQCKKWDSFTDWLLLIVHSPIDFLSLDAWKWW